MFRNALVKAEKKTFDSNMLSYFAVSYIAYFIKMFLKRCNIFIFKILFQLIYIYAVIKLYQFQTSN